MRRINVERVIYIELAFGAMTLDALGVILSVGISRVRILSQKDCNLVYKY